MERSVSMAAISNINTTVPKIWFPTHPSFVKSINGIQGIHKLMQENDGKSKIQSKICFRSCNSSNKANYVMLKGKKAVQEIEIGILSYEIPLIWSQKLKNK